MSDKDNNLRNATAESFKKALDDLTARHKKGRGMDDKGLQTGVKSAAADPLA